MSRFILFIIINFLVSQTSPRVGLSDHSVNTFLFKNATIHISPDEILHNANLVIKDNKIHKVGKNIGIEGAIEIDCQNKHIYPGFIDLYHPVDIDTTLLVSTTKHWNKRVHPEYVPNMNDKISESNKKLREKGFVVSMLSPKEGIFRGKGRIIHLGKQSSNSILSGNNIQHMAMESGEWYDDDYPGSLLGSIALIRQTFYDSEWYAKAWKIYNEFPKGNKRPEINDALNIISESLANDISFYFATDNERDLERVLKLKNEFNFNLWILGSGYEYRNLRLLDEISPFFILTPNFPKKPDVTTYSKMLDVSLNQLKHWDQAAFNPYDLYHKGIEFSFSSYGIKPKEFKKNIIKSIEYGLDEKVALAALTTIPANKLGLSDQLGTLEVGKLGYLIISDDNYFNENSKILSVWINTEEYVINSTPKVDISGEWIFQDSTYKAIIENDNNKFKVTLEVDTSKITTKNVDYNYPMLSFSYKIEEEGTYRYSGYYENNIFKGEIIYPDGSLNKIGLSKISNHIKENHSHIKKKDAVKKLSTYYPEGTYGYLELPSGYEYV